MWPTACATEKRRCSPDRFGATRGQSEIVVASMSCNSSRTTGLRPEIIDNLKAQDPDLLFFAGDQTYRHTEHTAGWIEFGLQFRDVIRDRPTICHPGRSRRGTRQPLGRKRQTLDDPRRRRWRLSLPCRVCEPGAAQQTWNLPDPVDPAPVERGIGVYFTRLAVGGVDFAILEDRKFKSGPAGQDSAHGAASRPHQRPRLRPEVDRPARPATARRAAGKDSSALGRKTGPARK